MGISTSFIQHNLHKLLPIIAQYLSNVMEFGIIPYEWKHSFIVPIPKKGEKHDISNYRGIALQSVIPKIFEKLLTSKLRKHLNQLIPKHQHGFVEGKSTTTNLIETTQFIQEQIHKGNQVDVIYFDFSKAFDRVNHTLLARKLAACSMPFAAYFTTMNFIIGRYYTLKVNGIPLQQKFGVYVLICPSWIPYWAPDVRYNDG